MKPDWKNLSFAIVPVACIFLFNGGVNAGLSVDEEETDQAARAMKTPAVDVEHGDQQPQSENENIIDRVFSPLDNAVTDINRDLNEEHDGPGD